MYNHVQGWGGGQRATVCDDHRKKKGFLRMQMVNSLR